MKTAGFAGHYTNHSLRVSAATHLFDSGVDEQLIMNRTGHSGTDGVRVYKRASEKLQEYTSDVLNQATSSTAESHQPAKKHKKEIEGKENQAISQQASSASQHPAVPVFNISGGTNFTINISGFV